MDKIVRLTTWERIQMRNMLLMQPAGNTFQDGNHGDDFFTAIELNEAEKIEIGFVERGSGGTWDEDKDRPWDTSLTVGAWRFVFNRLLHPQAIGWAFDRKHNELMKAKMERVLKEIESAEYD